MNRGVLVSLSLAMVPLIVLGKAAHAGAIPIMFPETTARHFTLDDGLGVIVQEDHSAPVASVQVWVDTGSIDEDKHLGAGLSHILEHMLFKGTEKRSTNEIAQKIQDSGGYINAYTSYDRTVFWIDIPSKGVPVAIDILADAMMNSTLPPEEYVREQEVIRREFAMGFDDPDRMSSLNLFANAYRVHPYRLPIIGYLEVYNKLTRDDVMAYYKKRYVPNNMFFVVAGDVDAQKVHDQIRDYFKKYPRQSLEPVYIPQEPPQLGRRDSNTEFATEHTRLELAWHIPAVTDPDVPALDLLSTILGGGRSSRLYKTIREEQGLVHAISAWAYTPSDPGLFGVSATLDPDKRAATIDAILQIIDDMKLNGVTEAELDKAKKQSLSGQFKNLTTTRGIASDLGSNWLLTRNLNFSREYLDAVQRVTPEDIRRVLRKYVVPDSLTVSSLNPQGSLAAEGAPKERMQAGEIQKFELSNGLRLLVREDPRLPLVSMVAVFKAGLLAETPQTNGITQLLSTVMLKGTNSRTAEQIADQIEAVGGSIGSEAGNNSMSVAVSVMKPDLDLGIDILADVLASPTLPEKAVARAKEIQIASIKSEEEEMTTVARNLLRANLYPLHPYGLRANGSPESVSSLTRDDLAKFKDTYVVARNAVLAVYGNVNAQEVKAMVERYFSRLPAGEPALTTPPEPAPVASSKTVETHKDKAQGIIMVGYRGTTMFDPDVYPLELIDEASSDLGSRFFIRIREKLGLAYFVGTGQIPGLVPGPFVFYLGTAPAKVDQVLKEFQDEIGKLATNGLTAEELARAKEKLIGQQEIRNQSNSTFAHITALDELYGLGYLHYKEEKAKIEAVTLEDTKRVANKFFLDAPEITAIARPKPPENGGPAVSPQTEPATQAAAENEGN